MTFRERFANMQNAGGNHPAQTTQGILQEGRKSFQQTIDNKLGTQNAQDAFAKKFGNIVPPPAQKIQPTKTITPKR